MLSQYRAPQSIYFPCRLLLSPETDSPHGPLPINYSILFFSFHSHAFTSLTFIHTLLGIDAKKDRSNRVVWAAQSRMTSASMTQIHGQRAIQSLQNAKVDDIVFESTTSKHTCSTLRNGLQWCDMQAHTAQDLLHYCRFAEDSTCDHHMLTGSLQIDHIETCWVPPQSSTVQ